MKKVPLTVLNMTILYFITVIFILEGLLYIGANATKLTSYKNIHSTDDIIIIVNPSRYVKVTKHYKNKEVHKPYTFYPEFRSESLLGDLFGHESHYKVNQNRGRTNVTYGFTRKKRSVNNDKQIVPGVIKAMNITGENWRRSNVGGKRKPAAKNKKLKGRKLKSSPKTHMKKGKKKRQGGKQFKPRTLLSKKFLRFRRFNGKNNIANTRRLIASKDANIEDFPYVVSIQKDGQHWCTGSLLNQRLIISTANCFWKTKRINRMRIRAGSRHVHEGGQMAKINEVMRHPYWSIRGLPDYDVALAYLDRNIRFSDKVHSVDLPNRAMMPPFDDAWVTGWGTERRDGVYTRSISPVALQVHHARLMDHAECNNITMRYGMPLSNNFICLSQSGKRAPCTRDTGSPAVSDGIIWGLASWGIRKMCGTERFPAMYSYLASPSNIDFIINATYLLMSDERKSHFPDRLPLRT